MWRTKNSLCTVGAILRSNIAERSEIKCLPYEPEITRFAIYPKEMNAQVNKVAWTRIFIVASIVLIENWK